jgi:hypothetical protein
MPALKNPRHEAFAQAILFGLLNSSRDTYSNGRAYQRAGYLTSNQNASDAAASRLLRKVKPILDRVRELQADYLKRNGKKLDLSRDRIGRNLDIASTIAQEDRNPAAIVAAEAQIAKVFHGITDQDPQRVDYTTAQSMHDIGKKLLQSIGFASPDDASIREAIELNDTFVDGLQAIYQRAQQQLEAQ